MNTRRRLLRCAQRAVDIREVILIRPSITLNGDCLRSESRCAQDDGRGIRFRGSPVAASPELFVCTQYPARVPVACRRRCIHSKCPRGERLRISLRFCSSCEIISSGQYLNTLTLSECSWVLRHMLLVNKPQRLLTPRTTPRPWRRFL